MVKGPEIHGFIFLPSFFQVVFLLLQYPNMVVFGHQQNYKKQIAIDKPLPEKEKDLIMPNYLTILSTFNPL